MGRALSMALRATLRRSASSPAMLRRMRHIAQPLLSRASTVRAFTLSSLPPTAKNATAPSMDVAHMHAKLQRLCDDNDFAGIVEEVAAYYRPLLQPLEGTAFDPVMTARVEEEAMALLAKYLQQDAATLLYENLQAMTAASPLVQPTPCTMSFLMSMLSSTDVEAAMDLALGRGVDPTASMNASYLEALISTKQLAKAAAFWRQLSDANGPRNPRGYRQAMDLFQTLQSVKDLKRIADDIVLHRIPLCELDYQNLMLGLAAGFQNKNGQANGTEYAEAVLMLLDNMQRVDGLSPSLGPIDVITMDARNYLGACDAAATTTSTSLLVDAAPTNDVAQHDGENPNSSNENGAAAGHETIVDVPLAPVVATTVPDIWGSPLYRAVLFNEPEKVKSLLPSSDIDAVTGGGDYPLYNAALNGRLEIVQLLVEAGATVAPANKGELPILCAFRRGHDEIVIYLAAKMDNVNILSSAHEPFLVCACGQGILSVVDALLRAGADCNAGNADGGTPLMAAAMKGHLATVARLLQEASLHVDARTKEGSTALYWAVNSQQPDDDTQVAIVSMLLAAGANPLFATNTNPTVFTQAITRGWRDVAELLLPYFDIDAGDLCYDETKTLQHFSYLRLAINTRRAHIVSWLLELGADANQEIDGHLPLLDAVMHSDASTLAVLLPYIKDLEVINPYGDTAVLVATIRAKVEMLQLLAAHGANVACVNQAAQEQCIGSGNEPKTAIVMASLLGHAAVVRCLLELGAPIDVPNVATQKGSMALAHAVNRGHGDVLRALLPRVDIDATEAHAPPSDTCLEWHQALLKTAMTTPLHAVVACEATKPFSRHGDYVDALHALLESPSVDVNGRSAEANGATALVCACERGNLDVVRALVANTDCDINAADDDDNTPLHAASQKGFVDLVAFLLTQQPRLHVIAENKVATTKTIRLSPMMTALQVATAHQDVVALLCQEPALVVHALTNVPCAG